jgi:hypothetical protein
MISTYGNHQWYSEKKGRNEWDAMVEIHGFQNEFLYQELPI